MTDLKIAKTYLEAEVAGLESFDFLGISPSGNPMRVVEVTRREDDALEVRIPGRPRPIPELEAAVRSRLRERGFASEDPADQTKPWVRPVDDAEAAVSLAQQLLLEVYEEKPGVPLDINHGSHRAAHEAELKLAATRKQIEQTLTGMVGGPLVRDEDGDYVIPIDDVHVTVAPRVAPDGRVVVRVFGITNLAVTITPELGLLLARLNFGLMFGRFALDAEHRSIWFDESLLGDHLSDEQLRFAVRIVATTADEWDDRLKQMFGGVTHQDVLKKRAKSELPPVKPGQGGYL